MDHYWQITCKCGHQAPASTFYPDAGGPITHEK